MNSKIKHFSTIIFGDAWIQTFLNNHFWRCTVSVSPRHRAACERTLQDHRAHLTAS